MATAHRGVGRVVVSDPDADRRELARELGAAEAYAPDDLDPRRLRATHVLDTVGRQETIDTGLTALRPLGVCATVALRAGANRVSVSQSQLLWGRALLGVIEGDARIHRDIGLLVALWRAGRLPIERLTRRYRFDEIAAAVEDARSGRAIKPVLIMDDAQPAASVPASRTPLTEILRDGRIPAADLPALWRSLPPAQHRTHRLLSRSRWFGKLFRSDDDVLPLVCESADGALTADIALARGGATLRTVEHDGISTAAMVYDGIPVIDLFTRIGPDAVLGAMTGRDTADRGDLYYFVLERVADRDVSLPA